MATTHCVTAEARRDRPGLLTVEATVQSGGVEYGVSPQHSTAGPDWKFDMRAEPGADPVASRERPLQRTATPGPDGLLRCEIWAKLRGQTSPELHWQEHTIPV